MNNAMNIVAAFQQYGLRNIPAQGNGERAHGGAWCGMICLWSSRDLIFA